MTQMDYQGDVANCEYNYYEWQANLLMFCKSGMVVLTIPPTLEAPPGRVLTYQTIGSLNKTYSWKGTQVVYVLPIKEGTGRLAIVCSRVLGPMDRNDSARVLQVDSPRLASHLLINEIEVGSPALQFDKFDDELLLKQGKVVLDVYYNEFPKYRHITYEIQFSHHRGRDGGIWLQVSLAGMLIIFTAILWLCISKSRKALKKPSPEAEIIKSQSATDNDEPLLNKEIPARLNHIQI